MLPCFAACSFCPTPMRSWLELKGCEVDCVILALVVCWLIQELQHCCCDIFFRMWSYHQEQMYSNWGPGFEHLPQVCGIYFLWYYWWYHKYSIIWCYTVLFFISVLLYSFFVDIYITLFFFIFHYIMNHISTMPYSTLLYSIMSYSVTSYSNVSYCIGTVLYSFVLYHFLFHSVILYCCYFSILYAM